MSFKFNPFINNLDYYEDLEGYRIPLVSETPATGENGEIIINTTLGEVLVYFNDAFHDVLGDFVANEYIDWTSDQGAINIHAGNIPDLSGTYQPLDADLTAIAGLSGADGNFIVGSATGWVAESGATARTSLGLGTMATQASNSVSITGGSVSGITDLAIADGGTGASTAADAFTALKQVATTSATGVVELATTAETSTGSDADRVVTPDGLAGSVFGRKTVVIKAIGDTTVLTVVDGIVFFTVPLDLDGMNLVSANAGVYTASSSGLPTVQIRNVTDSQDMLSTRITIDATETSSYTATDSSVVNTSYDDVAKGDVLAVDVDVAGTGTKGLEVHLVFEK